MRTPDTPSPATLVPAAAREWYAEDSRTVLGYVRGLPDPIKEGLAMQTAWTYGQFTDPAGRKCLIAWVAELRQRLSLPAEEPNMAVASAFDSLARRMGLWQAVALVRAAAGRLK